MLDQAQQRCPGWHQGAARLLLGKVVQATCQGMAMLIKKHLELGSGGLIDNVFGECLRLGWHVRSIPGSTPAGNLRRLCHLASQAEATLYPFGRTWEEGPASDERFGSSQC